jgi:SAM-dependent methyltransferase
MLNLTRDEPKLASVNEAHLRICSSPEWASYVADELLPWVLASYELGDDVLELGPGPGLTTDVLLRLVPRLTAVEIDKSLAVALALFTMLHHVPSAGLPDRLLAEARRVLRPTGVMVGTDGMDTPNGGKYIPEIPLFRSIQQHLLTA